MLPYFGARDRTAGTKERNARALRTGLLLALLALCMGGPTLVLIVSLA